MARRVVLSDAQWARIEDRLAAAGPPRVDDAGVHDAITGRELSTAEISYRRAAYRLEF